MPNAFDRSGPYVFERALAQQAPQMAAGYVDPEQAAYEAALAKLQQPRAPMFTPEQVQQRRADNDRDYQIGLLAQLSGDQNLGNVGGQVFKQALAARKPTINERGSVDQITGEFTYDPDYLAQRQEATVGAMGSRIAQRQATRDENRTKAQERADERKRHDEAMAEMRRLSAANGQVGAFQQAGFTPEGAPVVTNSRSGVNYLVSVTPEGTPTYKPYTGIMTPKATFDKNVTDAQEGLAAADKADSIIKKAKENPDAFGLGAAAVSLFPAGAQGYLGPLAGLTPKQTALRAEIARDASIELNRLFGAAQSRQELAKAAGFTPQATDSLETTLSKLEAARDWQREAAMRYGPGVVGAARGRTGGATGGWEGPGAAAPGKAAAPAAPLSADEAAELAALKQRFGK